MELSLNPMKFYETQEFRRLQKEWKEKLAQSEFQDIEKGDRLKDFDRRTISFENREAIHDFFRRLDTFLTVNEQIPDLHRTILSLYSEGRIIRDICRAVGRGRTTVKGIISHYRKVLTGRL